MKPKIGCTVSTRSGWRIFPLLSLNVWLAGGTALRWDTRRDVDLEAADGVIIGGGDDISPTLYGGELDTTARLDPARDELEKTIIGNAIDRGIPVLGICRGSQMLNVASGGNLEQDAYGRFQSEFYKTVLPKKTVTVEPGTRLDGLVGREPMKVNALHTQAVCKLGRDLRVAARDDGGMIQSIERTSDPFALGVQWHPEHLFYARRQRALFRALVAAARAYAQDRRQLKRVDTLIEAAE